ncbi:MAG TPA: DUF3187 family protein [Thermoanaerobaculia bacterium]|nr:DUF3187 family protein [Thermoanaerobaculia bacterium]
MAQTDAGAAVVLGGPVALGPQFLLSTGLLSPHPEAAAVLAAGVGELGLQYGVANTFAKSDALDKLLEAHGSRAPLSIAEADALARRLGPAKTLYFLDGEVSRTAITLRRGFAGGLELEAVLPVIDAGGGYTDRLIEGFHSGFGLSQNERLTVPRNTYTVYLRSGATSLTREVAPGPALGDLVLGAKLALPPTAGLDRLAIQLLGKAPTGARDSLYSSGRPDLGVQLLGGRAFARSSLHFTLSALALSSWKELGTPSQLVLAGSFAYERALFSSYSALLQLDLSQSPFRREKGSPLTANTYLATLAVHHSLGRDRTLYLAFTENLFSFDNTADAGLLVGVRRRF